MIRVLAELGAGNITEDPKLRSDIRGERLEGLQQGKHIWVNPIYGVVDTVIHECLHRAFPSWTENYVRNRTSFLMRRMTIAEIETVYDEYMKRARRKKA